MEAAELKELHESLKKTHEAFKEINDRREKEIEEFKAEQATTRSALEKLNERLDDIDTRLQRPGTPSSDPDAKTDIAKAFEQYVRKGDDRLNDEERKLIVTPWAEYKALASDQQDDGGYLVIPEYSDRIVEKLIEFSPIRELATVERISMGNEFKIPAEGSGNFGAQFVNERQTAGESTTGDVRMVTIPVYEIEARPRITHQLLEDAAYDVEGWMMRRLGKRFGVVEGTKFVNGTGANEPEGLMTNGDVGEVAGGNASALTADGFIDTFYGLPELYANNSTWLMRRATVGAARKLKDGDGQYLWQPGLMAGQPATLLGRPVREAIDMPAIAANAYPVLFGDFREGYTVVDRIDIRTLRDPYSAKPFIELYTVKRVGGKVVLGEAFVKMKIATSV